MARTLSTVKTPAAKSAKVVSSTTPVRHSAIPKAAAPASVAKAAVTHAMIAFRAYEIASSGCGGSDMDNWFRAERELGGR